MSSLFAPQPFVPRPRQRRLLAYIDEHPGFKTVHELCAAAGIGRTTYYRWSQDPGFRLWLASAWSARLMMEGVVLLNIARLNSTRSYPYWKALFDLTFDPRGLGMLQHWQAAVAHADPDAGSPPALSQVPPPPKPNQPVTPENGTRKPSAIAPGVAPQAQSTAPHSATCPPRPHHVARCLQRALASRRPAVEAVRRCSQERGTPAGRRRPAPSEP